MRGVRRLILLLLAWGIALLCRLGCSNNPWPAELNPEDDTLFLSYGTQIKTLDPTSLSYIHEGVITGNVSEPALTYHYLARPYRLIPQLLEELPEVAYWDAAGNRLGGDPPAEAVARCEYTLKIKQGVLFQPHPCFADASQVRARVKSPKRPADFGPMATRELEAADFKTALVRLCDGRLSTSVFSSFSTFIKGMHECSDAIAAEVVRLDAARLSAGEAAADLAAYPSVPDYRALPFDGCEIVDSRTLKIILTRKYPQFIYWLAMHYTAPIPQEALEFYARPDVRRPGLDFATWPVGTGPYMLTECDPNARIVLERNPNYNVQCYPDDGASEEDVKAGLMEDAGKPLPLTSRIVYNFERESIPNWLKFQQGYYDNSGVPNDMFDSAITFSPGSGELRLSDDLARRGVSMTTSVPPITYYFAFNMLDPLLGGLSPQKCALRQALSISIDTDEYITIFKNGNGVPADGIIPPGLFGAAEPPERMNNVLFRWDEGKGKPVRRGLEEAKALMAKAGYPDGIDPATGKPLVICLDHADAGKPDFKNRFQWLSERFARLGVRLQERPSDLNRNRDKLNNGNWQMLFERGWVADYPDSENFLFLFYSENGRVVSKGLGANYSNYASEAFDKVFKQLETMADSPERLKLIDQANAILDHDAPYCWGYHPVNSILTHQWLRNYKPNGIATDTLKYLRIDSATRARLQRQWNRPSAWIFFTIPLLLTILLAIPGKKRHD